MKRRKPRATKRRKPLPSKQKATKPQRLDPLNEAAIQDWVTHYVQ
jgi:hypothetical protein